MEFVPFGQVLNARGGDGGAIRRISDTFLIMEKVWYNYFYA
jgi:hypothetical protein